jgi:hypothetical protein
MLGVAAHGAVIEPDALGREHPLLSVEREPPAVLLYEEMRDHRGREEPALDQLPGFRNGVEDRWCGVLTRFGGGLGLVRRAGDDEAHPSGATMRQPTALLEANALDVALARGVQELDALLGHVFRREVTTPLRLRPRLRRGRRRWRKSGRWRRVKGERRGEGHELLLHLRELQLELRDVDTLRLRGVDAPAKKLQLLLELLVGAPKLVALGGHFRQRRLRARECDLEPRDATERVLELSTLRRVCLAHGANL